MFVSFGLLVFVVVSWVVFVVVVVVVVGRLFCFALFLSLLLVCLFVCFGGRRRCVNCI